MISSFDAASYRTSVEDAAAHVRAQADTVPTTALILGTGLGGLKDDIDVSTRLPYEDIPGFPTSTTSMHEGELLIGTLQGAPVLAMNGRMHLYEGYTAHQVAFPIRVMGVLGIEHLLISNAAGGMDPHFDEGDLMLITDHINEQGTNPLVGPNIEDWGPRFPDMSEPYDADLRTLARSEALKHEIHLYQGIYLAVLGPMLETRAEYRYMRDLGADVVGMSTVPEVIAAHHMGIRCLADSVITDICLPDALEPVDIESIMAAAASARPRLQTLFSGVVQSLA